MDKKTLKNLTPFERWQLEKYGNIVDNVSDEQFLENGIDKTERFSEWIEAQHTQQMLKDEEYYSSLKD